MQKIPNATILRKRKPIQNNLRLWKLFQNQNAKKNGNLRSKRIYKLRSKTAELPFANLKQNMYLTEFKTTGLKQVNTEFKLYATGHNLKRIRKIKKPGKQKSIKKICVPSSF